MRSVLRSLRSFLNRPVFGTRVIPKHARVDPERFSEREFPVWCPACGYALRGLAGGRCPECGREFERGRLLVEIYVLRRWDPASNRSWIGKVWRRTLSLMFVCHVAICAIAAVCWLWSRAHPGALKVMFQQWMVAGMNQGWLQLVPGVVYVMAVLLTLGAATIEILMVAHWSSIRRKRRRILAAIDDHSLPQAPTGNS